MTAIAILFTQLNLSLLKAEAKSIATKKVELNKSIYTLKKGKKVTLKTKVSPANATKRKITWQSSKPSVASINASGVVSAKKNGKTYITATVKGTKVKDRMLLIVGTPVTSVNVRKTRITLDAGKSANVGAKVSPSNASTKSVNYKSFSTSVATVSSSGVITARSPGTAKIQVTAKDGTEKKKYVTVTVKKVNKPIPVITVTRITLNASNAKITVGDKLTLKATVNPSNAANKTVSWTSDNIAAATVNNGVVTGLKPGTAKITAKSNNGKTAYATITVLAKTIPVNRLDIDKESITLETGNQANINVNVLPSNATNKQLNFSSSDTSVASVSANGTVTANAAGYATITVKSGSISRQCLIAVYQKNVSIESMGVKNGGLYRFCLASNRDLCLDVNGAVAANGTNVLLYSKNDSKAQKFTVQALGNNEFRWVFGTDTGKVLDVNRGTNDYATPLSIGNNVDIWDANDAPAQSWKFTRLPNGTYIMNVPQLSHGALAVDGAYSGANAFINNFDINNPNAQWVLEETSITPDPPFGEYSKWIFNTDGLGVNVRSGPGTQNPVVGGFVEGQEITVTGNPQAGDWYPVRGANRNGGAVINGFVRGDFLGNKQDDPWAPLKAKFPNGAYWNHNGGNNPDGYTWGACTHHYNCDFYGNCACNSYSNAIQCHGFALKLAAERFGTNPRNWGRVYNLNSLKEGDIIRYKNDGHTIIVTKVEGNTITYADCNATGSCKIRWGATMQKSNITGLNYVLSR